MAGTVYSMYVEKLLVSSYSAQGRTVKRFKIRLSDSGLVSFAELGFSKESSATVLPWVTALRRPDQELVQDEGIWRRADVDDCEHFWKA